jgi:hypothetical protein
VDSDGVVLLSDHARSEDLQIPSLHPAQPFPTRPIVERETRTANRGHVREPVTLPGEVFMQPGQQTGEFVPLREAVVLGG